MSILDTEVLKLNKNWVPLDIISVRQAFSDACAGAVTFLRFQDGYPSIYRLEDWLKMDADEKQDYITTSRLHEVKRIAVPRVVICTTYDKLIAKEQKCTLDNLHRRYKGRDAVTGKPLPRHKASREHVKPRSRGGEDGWGNEVPMHRKTNSRRGNKTYAEAGLPEPKILPPPPPLLPINSMVNRHGFPEWELFHIPRA